MRVSMWSPWPGPTATATRPEVATRLSASMAPSSATAPRLSSMVRGAGNILARSGIRAPSVTDGYGTGLGQVVVVVHLDPVDLADWGGVDYLAAVDHLLIAVLVV